MYGELSGHSLLKVSTTNFHTRAKRTDEVNSKSVFGMFELIMLLLLICHFCGNLCNLWLKRIMLFKRECRGLLQDVRV